MCFMSAEMRRCDRDDDGEAHAGALVAAFGLAHERLDHAGAFLRARLDPALGQLASEQMRHSDSHPTERPGVIAGPGLGTNQKAPLARG